mmetsp:Transcript_123245/g.307769  ORF Transcript_123245/g.307769 Transcript_123245/m.307769 type:complete len:453 (-) Transcript_123245:235-1593(-)
MDVRVEPILAGNLIDQFEGHVELPASIHELHEQGQGEVAWLHSLPLHTVEQLETLVHEVVLRATVEQRVVHDLVRLQAGLALHLFEDVEALLDITGLAMAFHHSAVGDEVRLDLMLLHVCHDRWHAIHSAAPCASIKKRVVHDDGYLDLAALHLLVDGPDPLHLLLAREALQHGAVDHCVQRVPEAVVVLHLVDQLVSTLGVAIAHNCLHHAPQGDACRTDVAAAHLLPAPPDTVDVLGVPVGLDQASERVRAGDGQALRALELLELVGEQLGLADADASLHHRAEQHLIHRLLHGANEVHGLEDVILPRVRVKALEQDGASDLVWLHTGGLHLPDDAPNLSSLRLGAPGHQAVDKLVEGDSVRLQSLLAHFLHEAASLGEVLVLKVGLDQCVIRDDVRQTDLLSLRHPCLGRLQVVALYTSIEDCVIHDAIDLGAALAKGLKDLHGTLQVP